MKFLLKYEQKKHANTATLPLEIGTITHYGKELIGLALMEGKKPDYDAIREIVMAGYDDEVEKVRDENGELLVDEDGVKTVHVLGVNELKEKYFYEWIEKDDKSGMNYDEKLKIYFDNLHNLEADDTWKPIACELEFDFVFQDLFRLYGFIDRVDINSAGEYRVVDYKSSKKVFDDKYTKTPLQMFIYSLAVEHVFGKVPVEHMYDFMLIDKLQHVCSSGYYNRGMKKLLKLWGELNECRSSGIFMPKATPLCHWCDYCRTNKNAADLYIDECPYYSLWEPNNKTFEKNKEYCKNTADTPKKAEGFWF